MRLAAALRVRGLAPVSVALAWLRPVTAMSDNPLLTLFGYFALLSLFAVGGANAAIPEMHRIAVDVMHWMNDRQFADMFAIAQVSPGPNVIIVTLIGYHVAGLAGAAVATVGDVRADLRVGFFVGRTWDRFKDARWRIAIQAGLVPVSLGLIGASAFVLARAADHSIYAGLITAATAAVAFWTRVNPLWVFLARRAARAVRLALAAEPVDDQRHADRERGDDRDRNKRSRATAPAPGGAPGRCAA